MSSDSSFKKIARNIGIFGGAQCFTVAAALVRAKVVALLIGPAGIGLNALLNTISNFIASLSGLGISSSAVRSLSEVTDDEVLRGEVRRVRRWGMLTAAFGGAITLLLAPILSRYYMEDYSHTTSFALLAIAVASITLTGCEMAVMKSSRRVRQLAQCTIVTAILSVVTVVPFIYYWRMEGIVWALVISSLLVALYTLQLGYRLLPTPGLWSLPVSKGREIWHRSRPMLVLGMAFVASGMLSTGADLLIQSVLATTASLSVLGFYRAGIQLGITYTGLIFTAIINDLYPRLSAVHQDTERRNLLVDRQIVVLLCIVVPFTMIFVALVPYLIPLLFSHEFDAICPMVQAMAWALPLQAIALPIGCLPLALGKSLHFFVLELISWTLFALFVLGSYFYGGLSAIGMAIVWSRLIDLLIVVAFCYKNYGYRFKWQSMRRTHDDTTSNTHA